MGRVRLGGAGGAAAFKRLLLILVSTGPDLQWLAGRGQDLLVYITHINNRLEDATGLTMSTAEDLQVSHFVGKRNVIIGDFASREVCLQALCACVCVSVCPCVMKYGIVGHSNLHFDLRSKGESGSCVSRLWLNHVTVT